MISHIVLCTCILIFGTLHCNNFACADQNEETVLVTSSSSVKYIEVPTSDGPVLTWLEVRKGTFPNLTNDLAPVTNVTVGEPITLLIFYKDNSNLYDIAVTDCWAYDDENFPLSKQRLHLSGNPLRSDNDKVLSEWKKFRSRKSASFLYASFTSFKFPEKDKIYLTCDIQLIGAEQSKSEIYKT